MTWTAYRVGEKFFVGRTDREGYIVHTHPIPFDSQREADRAVARLNAKLVEAS